MAKDDLLVSAIAKAQAREGLVSIRDLRKQFPKLGKKAFDSKMLALQARAAWSCTATITLRGNPRRRVPRWSLDLKRSGRGVTDKKKAAFNFYRRN